MKESETKKKTTRDKEKSNDFNCMHTPGKVAILIDGGFFLKRIYAFCHADQKHDVGYAVKMVNILCHEHAKRLQQTIYRIFFYDCAPLETGALNPLTKKYTSFKKSSLYEFKIALFEELKQIRKMALRLGRLHHDQHKWLIKPEKITALLNKKISIDDLHPENDIIPNVRQKQVDMKIGVDITSLALKKQINTIVLIAGDGDFVPAAKLARREGIDFILDPIWNQIQPELNEHIDGKISVLFNSSKAKK